MFPLHLGHAKISSKSWLIGIEISSLHDLCCQHFPISFLPFNCSTEQIQQSLSRQDARCKEFLTADFRRFPQTRIRTFHRRDAEYAEVRLFAQSGDDDWAKTFSSNLRDVFVCRRLPTNKKVNSLRPLRLCGNILKGISSAYSASLRWNVRILICDNR